MSIGSMIKLKVEQLKYYWEKENKVYMLIVSYGEEPTVQFGVTDMRTEYMREKKITNDILARYYEEGTGSYVTYEKGEFLYAYENPFVIDEKIIIVYRPSRKDKKPRDYVFFRLLYGMKLFIEGRNKLINGDTSVWQVSQEVINLHIRKNNQILFELEKLIEEYCMLGV